MSLSELTLNKAKSVVGLCPLIASVMSKWVILYQNKLHSTSDLMLHNLAI